jgi:hypothetical protein
MCLFLSQVQNMVVSDELPGFSLRYLFSFCMKKIT